MKKQLTGLFALIVLISGCSLSAPFLAATPTPTPPFYSLKGGGACVQLGNKSQPPDANIRVSNDTFAAHSEPYLAIDPANPLHLIGGSKFFSDPARYQFSIGTYASFDGGCTWTDNGVLPVFPDSATLSDITVDFSPNGDVYAATLNTDNKNRSGIQLNISHDGGKTFGPAIHVFEDDTGREFSDKPWIAVDRSHGPHRGRIYVAWSYDYNQPPCGTTIPCTQELGLATSDDGGQTFAKPALVEGNAPFCANPADGRPAHSSQCDGALGAVPVIEPDGTLVVVYDYVKIDFGAAAYPTRILAIVSHDGGITWNSPVQIAQIHDLPDHFVGVDYRLYSLPTAVSDASTGRIYVAWSAENVHQSDIFLSTSSDQGKTWSIPTTVDQDSGAGINHFQPALAIAPNGIVSLSYFDTSVDPKHMLIDVFLAQSRDGGQTFAPAVRVTTQSWDSSIDEPIDDNGQGFIGDYQGIAANDHFVYPFWNDTRTGKQEIFVGIVPSIHH